MMEPLEPNTVLEPGVYRGTPDVTQLMSTASKSTAQIRTMKNDMDEAVRTQNETAVSIALAEEKKIARLTALALEEKQNSPEVTAPAPKRFSRVFVIVVLLVVIALIGLGYVFILPKLSSIKIPSISVPSFGRPADNPVVPLTTVAPTLASSLIPAKSEKRFNISNTTAPHILDEISTEIQQGGAQGSIKNLYFEDGASTPTVSTAGHLLTFLDVSAPEMLTRSLEKPYMVGLIEDAAGYTIPFLILTVSDHDVGLAGMLDWEATLPQLFSTMFEGSSRGQFINKVKFRDTAIAGKDARIFTIDPKTSVAYTFVGQKTLIIAGSRSALEALIPLAPRN